MTAYGRPNATGRSSGKLAKKEQKLLGPPPGQSFVWETVEMLRSPAWQGMSLHCRKFIDFLEIEHGNHAGRENGRLQATYEQLIAFGIPRKRITDTIWEAEQRGLVEVTLRGGLYGPQRRTTSKYRLTWIGTLNPNMPATNEWRRVTGKKISPRTASDTAPPPASGTVPKRHCRYLAGKQKEVPPPASGTASISGGGAGLAPDRNESGLVRKEQA